MRSLEERRRLTELALQNLGTLHRARGRRVKTTTYGQKDGESPTKGKKSATYRVTFPDGTDIEKRSFKVDQETAYALVYQHQGKWYVSAIRGKPVDAERQSTVLAIRI